MEILIMSLSKSLVRTRFLSLSLVISLGVLSSCELSQNYMKHDRENNMQEQDYRDALAPRPLEVDASARDNSKIPPLKSYVANPNLNYKPMPLVSVSVNQTIPLRDVIYEIARQAQYDVELDPRITGSIIFSARNRPLDMVIERIADIAGLRYNFRDDMLRVEIDTPYHETYKINYLTLTRTNSSSISNDISVVSGEGSDTGSTFSATNDSVIDFWGELETNLTQILESNRDSNRLTTAIDPNITVADSNPAPVSPLMMDENGNLSETGPNVQVQAPQAVLNVNSLPVEGEESSGSDEDDPFEARFSLNKQAGMISVFAPERLHKKVASYMDDLKKSVSAQVLIEAKVLEVSLNDEFSAGIDWSQANINLFGGTGGLGFGPSQNPGFVAGGLVRGILDTSGATVASNSVAGFARGDFAAAVDALSRFGTVQALASPRLTVLNNQSAALNVAENVVYFEITSETVPVEGAAPIVTSTSEIKSVPEGVLINVQPAIDLDLQRVSMAIRPTITSITATVPDPVTPTNLIPQVNVQEFDSIIQVNNGQAVVLGGLLQDRIQSTRNGIPVLGEVPLFGGLFRNQQDSIKKTELVVFLKATIVDGGNTVHNTDKDLYRTFSSDRRPFKF
jgi:general secretion pathway protein D